MFKKLENPAIGILIFRLEVLLYLMFWGYNSDYSSLNIWWFAYEEYWKFNLNMFILLLKIYGAAISRWNECSIHALSSNLGKLK